MNNFFRLFIIIWLWLEIWTETESEQNRNKNGKTKWNNVFPMNYCLTCLHQNHTKLCFSQISLVLQLQINFTSNLLVWVWCIKLTHTQIDSITTTTITKKVRKEMLFIWVFTFEYDWSSLKRQKHTKDFLICLNLFLSLFPGVHWCLSS